MSILQLSHLNNDMISDLLVSAWGRASNYWLGGRLIDDQWQWVGRVTGPILYSFWGGSEPSNSDGIEKVSGCIP